MQASPEAKNPTWPAGQATIASPHGSSSTPQPTRAWRRAAGQDRSASPDHELPAGFWVGRNGGQTVRRPLVPACCQQLDPRSDHAITSDG